MEKYQEKHPKCKLEILSQEELSAKKLSIPIRKKVIPATPQDQQEFKVQIEELLSMKLIRKSNSEWSSPAFMVRNHSEIKRGKPTA